MEKLTILTVDLLDILFEYRNKLYGAYELRRTYPKRMAYAMAGTFFVCLLFAGSTMLANSKKATTHVDLVKDIVLTRIDDPAAPPPPPPPLPPHVDPPPVEMSQFNPPRIVPDDQVKPEDEIADIDKLADTKIGSINQDGVKGDDIVTPPAEPALKIAEAPKTNIDVDDKFTPVQISASFPGGADAWNRYLQKNLNSEIPTQNGAPLGKYTVTVSFVVSTDGSISDVRAENDPGFGTRAEAIRVIQKGPRWSPAEQNGRKVVYRHKQSITFQVAEE